MRIPLLTAALLIATGAVHAADTYTCRSLGETAFPATASFDLDLADGVYTVPRAELLIEGDIGYSTHAGDQSGVAFVSEIDAASGALRLVFHQTYDQYDTDVATLHVVTLSEGAHSLTAGVLHIAAGGLWPIQCDVTYGR